MKLRNFFQSPGARLALYLTVPTIIVAFIIILVTSRTTPSDPTLSIDNFSEVLPDVPEISRRAIEEKLYQEVAAQVTPTPTSGALIRENSTYSFTLKPSFTVGDFIVDVESVQQSYRIKYFYGELEGSQETELSASVQLFCLAASEVIYENSVCPLSSDFSRSDPIEYLLPKDFPADRYSLESTYSTTSSSGFRIIITLDPPESVYLSGETDAFEKETYEKVAEFLKTNGLDPENYEYFYKYKVVR